MNLKKALDVLERRGHSFAIDQRNGSYWFRVDDNVSGAGETLGEAIAVGLAQAFCDQCCKTGKPAAPVVGTGGAGGVRPIGKQATAPAPVFWCAVPGLAGMKEVKIVGHAGPLFLVVLATPSAGNVSQWAVPIDLFAPNDRERALATRPAGDQMSLDEFVNRCGRCQQSPCVCETTKEVESCPR